MKKKNDKKKPVRNGFALAAKMRNSGKAPMKHRCEPRGGDKNDQREYLEELEDSISDDDLNKE